MGSRAEFVEALRVRFYGEASPLPVPFYILDAALWAALSTIHERGRAGLSSYLEFVGTFFPYVRPGREMKVGKWVQIGGSWKFVKEVRVIPARRWFYFRSSRMSAALSDFAVWGRAFESNYSGGDDGRYKAGRRAVWEAARGELSKVSKGREWGAYFVHGPGGLVASPAFVNGFFARVVALLGEGWRIEGKGFGVVRADIEWRFVVDPATGRSVRKGFVKAFVYERFRSAALGEIGAEGGGVGGWD